VKKKMTRPDKWSMVKGATLGGRGNWSLAATQVKFLRVQIFKSEVSEGSDFYK
jgi:hypothetical protein